MKKLLSLLLVLFLVFTFTACAGNTDADTQEGAPVEEIASTVEEESNIIPEESQPDEVVTLDGNAQEEETEAVRESETGLQQTVATLEPERQSNDTTEAGKTLVVYISHTGTTESVVDRITDAIDADVFEIIPINAYPSNYNEHLDVAQQELNDDVRPAITSSVSNIEDYDTILIGYPIWWGYAPRPVATFLEGHDLSGKTIAPFCTSGSSGMGRSADEIAVLSSGAEIASGLSITSSNTDNTEGLVRDWLFSLGLL